MPVVLKRLTEKLGVRLVVIKGWKLIGTTIPEGFGSIKVISSAPNNILLPYEKAAIYYGGLSTIAACSQAGKFFIICHVLYPPEINIFGVPLLFKKVALKQVPLKS